MRIFGWGLHVHHKGPVIEPLIEPIEARQDYIRAVKPEVERALRLRLLRRLTAAEVRRIPATLREARRAYDEAERAYDEAGRAPALVALPAAICIPDCPWAAQPLFGGMP